MPSVKGAEGKAAQRKRNKEAGGTTRSGSTGSAKRVQDYPAVDWTDIADEVVHLHDVAGKLTHSQVGAAGQMIATLSVPIDYAHALLDVHMKARDGLVYMRLYYVSLADFLGEMDDDDDEDDEDDDE
jgi:hypothetical protein